MGKVYPHLGRLSRQTYAKHRLRPCLSVSLTGLRPKNENKPVPTEPDSKSELPEIDYSLLRAACVVDVKDQDCQFQPQPLGLNG
jgi:hypothetical protein